MMEVKFWRDVIEKSGDLVSSLRAGRLNAAYVESQIDGIPPSFTPKPFHSLFISLFSLATGMRSEWVGSLWSAILGTLTIGLVGWWTARHFGALTGILAAALLALGRSHVMYSRSQLAEADAMFFMCLAVFLHVNVALKYRKDGLAPPAPASGFWLVFAIGVMYGIAVAVNYRCLILMPLIWLWDMWVAREAPKRLLKLGFGLLAVMCLIELPYRIYIWRGGTLPAGVMTYFEGFWSRLFQDLPMGGGSFFRPHGHMFQFYLYLEGLWWILGILLGLWATVQSRCPVRRLVCLAAWVPLVLFSLVGRGDGPRAVMTSIPFFAILSAIGWIEYDAWFKKRNLRLARILVAALVGCVLIGGAAPSFSETRVRSAWPAAGVWLRQMSPSMVHTTNPLAVRFYLGKDRAKLVAREDTAPITPGIWVIDRYNAAYSYPYDVVRRLREQQKPEQVFEGLVYPQTGLFLDWGAFVRDRNWREELKRDGLGAIEVYRVEH